MAPSLLASIYPVYSGGNTHEQNRYHAVLISNYSSTSKCLPVCDIVLEQYRISTKVMLILGNIFGKASFIYFMHCMMYAVNIIMYALLNVGIQLLRSKYNAVLQSLPTDYEKTLQAVQDYLTDEQICAVLGSSHHSFANKVMLDALTDKVQSKGDLLQFCSQLEKIHSLLSDSTTLANLIGEFRKRMNNYYNL